MARGKGKPPEGSAAPEEPPKPKFEREPSISERLAKVPGIDAIIGWVENGDSYTAIAARCGVNRGTLMAFLARPENADRSARAHEESAEAWLDKGIEAIESAMKKDGNVDAAAARAFEQACARRAAFRNRRYVEKTAHEHSGPNGGPVPVTTLTPEQWAEHAKIIASEV